jgi:glutamate racemase
MTSVNDMCERPIGVFDSGVGGLTVWRALQEELPNESFIYLGDTARVPYGNKSAETVARYSTNIADELVERGCKALVIACNTASAYAFDAVEKHVDLPVVDVVRPVSFEVATHTKGTIAVIGTRGTVGSRAYLHAIHQHAPDREVIQKACPLFVPLAEEGWLEGAVPAAVVREYLSESFGAARPQHIILGCTHYPLLRGTIDAEVTGMLGYTPVLHDSGSATARRLRALLEARNLRAQGGSDYKNEWLVTDSPEAFQEVATLFIGITPESVEHVDLQDRSAPSSDID